MKKIKKKSKYWIPPLTKRNSLVASCYRDLIMDYKARGKDYSRIEARLDQLRVEPKETY